MKILAIETSCDETSAAVVEKKGESVYIYSNITATSLSLHSETGGIIPEQAAREQIRYIIPTIVEALVQTEENVPSDFSKKFIRAQELLKKEIAMIAVTQGPGLIGSLLVGVETAKTLSFTFNKPLIPVNHLLAHLYANFIASGQLDAKRSTLNAIPITFPFIGLIVSGNHTDLLYFKNHNQYEWLGGTRDDAAGEAFDKIGRMLILRYPAGPEIEKRAKSITSSSYQFKSPLLHSEDLDFSFSGLKTEVLREVKKIESLDETIINEICLSTQKAIVDVLVFKTLKASEKYNCETIVLGGGVSANENLRKEMKLKARRSTLNPQIFFPEKKYTTDNAAMIGAWATFHPQPTLWKDVQANPELYFDK